VFCFLWPDMSARITFKELLPAADGRAGVLIPRSAVRGETRSGRQGRRSRVIHAMARA
jgi:hypothetical protein